MDQRSLSAILIGLSFIALPSVAQPIMEIPFPTTATILLSLYGAVMIVGGFYSRKADRYKFLLDIYSIIGIFIAATGPITGFPLGQEFWTTIGFVTIIFMGLPTVLLLKANP